MDDLLKQPHFAASLPTQMTAVGHPGPRSLDEQDALVTITLPLPQPSPRDLLVRVHATAVNPIDVKLRVGGKASAEAPRILGFEAAGEVVGLGG
ncbi:alcohol dehydrogenase catalytic domain-containing protein [Tianweitania sp. BSSL-BM11]|uniref:Alcohol dehydrogenase catalytic domain-containing protein n=1 Tax=Tianweitania aestuarii TaxID=2814886 RepID=A0ABS5RVT6_9HYPH|nr:alcohol dehydrogenase catalytic domain-containing protein [Tianweitania aestuarii]MBS9721136.1 alcohol dehydrogenase catalytic domain-containing protein [Tianweitania aestuarii]